MVVRAVFCCWRDITGRILKILVYHMMLSDQVEILHQAFALVVLCLARHLDDIGAGHGLELVWHPAHLFHVLTLLYVLHRFPLLAFLAWNLLLLGQERLVLLMILKVLILYVQIHTLQSLMIDLIDLLVDTIAVRDALDAALAILLGEIDAVGSHGRVVLGLRFHLHAFDHLIVELSQVVGVLQALDVVLCELMRVLERVRMVDVDIRVVVIDDHDAAAELFHVLRSVARVLLLMLGLSLLHLLLVLDVMLIE